MDMGHELGRMKKFLAVLILFGVGCYFALEEFDYFTRGKETMAKIVSMTRQSGRRSGSERLHIGFAFLDPSGAQRTGEAWEAVNWVPPTHGLLKIQYTPGTNGRARVLGNVNWIGLALFFGSLAIFGFFGIRLMLEAVAATTPPKRKKRRRDDDY
jgi:hypothetical protein